MNCLIYAGPTSRHLSSLSSWILKRFHVTRALGWFSVAAGAVIFPLCPILFIVVQPKYTVANLVPQYLLEWLFSLVFAIIFALSSRWSVTKLSAVSLVQVRPARALQKSSPLGL